jgi:hypothetical protein
MKLKRNNCKGIFFHGLKKDDISKYKPWDTKQMKQVAVLIKESND